MLRPDADIFVQEHIEETRDLLRTLGKIPAPSHMEDKRAAFIKNWLEKNGAQNVYIDSAKNVVWPLIVDPSQKNAIVMAHTDVVFPDLDELEMHEDNEKIYAPGIGDDTANLVNLLMAGKYLLQQNRQVKTNLLIVANSCEEGLGNLDGTKQLMNELGGQALELISLDGGMTGIVNDAVGSHRYRIHIKAEGGHSFGRFGNTNAIAQMADLIHDFYQVQVPDTAKTTYNVGTISGGTTVNSIAEECEILYEYRSSSQVCLNIMKETFESIVQKHREAGVEITVEILGIRPGRGDVDENAQADLLARAEEILKHYTDEEIKFWPGSTDCNIPLSMGIPAACYGTYRGNGAHTRGEWVEWESLVNGQRIALETLEMYLEK